MAETENLRNRFAKQLKEAKDYAITGFAKDLIPVMDNLSRALEHIQKNITNETKNFLDGVQMIKKELDDVFEKNSLESINPQAHDQFDYNHHHAISEVVTEEYISGSVVETAQQGYKIKDRLIRPAAVVVAKNDK